MDSQDDKKKQSRPPIVAILGHIDHGKSSLLDYIRKTNVVEKEHGGITQHIKAYEVEIEADGKKKKITFLDTPGHEAFCSVRERGSSIADIVILIISAEDGIKPQTVESIKCIKESNTPFIIAINKIDRPNADADRVKTELAEHGVLVEGWGGNISVVLISAKTGEGVNDLLETLILQAEVEEISGNPEGQADGFIIESEKDNKKGIVASLVIKNGILRKGMFVVAGKSLAVVRMIEDCTGKIIEKTYLSQPVKVSGWNELPQAGFEFHSFDQKTEAEKEIEKFKREEEDNNQNLKKTDESRKIIPVIIKADTVGSVEAVEYELKKISNDKVLIKIIRKGVGPVSLGDVKLSLAIPDSILLCFNTETDNTAKLLALRNEIVIKNFNIIYDLLNWVSEKIIAETPLEQIEKIGSISKILKTFSRDKNKQVLGGKVEQGSIKTGDNVKILRKEVEVGEGKVKELQTQKIKTSKVDEDIEFGLLIDSKIELVPGDKIISYGIITK